MITFNEDGSTTIDFPNGPVRIKAPTFGALRRLRAERVRLARKAQDDLTAWEQEHPAPVAEGDEESDPVAVARHAEDRILAAEEANLASTAAWWKLILLGDESFQKLAESAVPEDVDEWPSALLFDIRPVIPPNSSIDVVLSAQSAPDRWVRHAGNFRSSSGPSSNGATTATNQPSPVL